MVVPFVEVALFCVLEQPATIREESTNASTANLCRPMVMSVTATDSRRPVPATVRGQSVIDDDGALVGDSHR